jgi:hypothetical protein
VTLLASMRFHILQNWQRTVSLWLTAFVSVSIRSPGVVSFPR